MHAAITVKSCARAANLLNFADVHADELEFMREVWNEIELQLDRESDPN